jgi:hypothetical protein
MQHELYVRLPFVYEKPAPECVLLEQFCTDRSLRVAVVTQCEDMSQQPCM